MVGSIWKVIRIRRPKTAKQIVMLFFGLVSLLSDVVNCFTDAERRQNTLGGLKQITDIYTLKAHFIIGASLGDYYITGIPLTVGENEFFNVIPNSMDLDTALNGFQCETPSCRAICQGFGFRSSLSSDYITNGTIFSLNQTYEAREGVRSQDTFNFLDNLLPPVPLHLSNVTFMNSFYVFPKEPISTNNITDICGVGNGTLGFGRGMEGVMGETIMSRFMKAAGADVLGILYRVYLDPMQGELGIFNRLEFDPSRQKEYPTLISEWPLWTLPITDLSFNGISFGANGIGVIDTASTFMRMPTSYTDLLAQILMATPQETSVGRQYIIPNCDPVTLPNITINISADQYNITGLAYARPTGGDCLALFMGVDSTYDGTPIWRLGYPFIGAASTFLNYTSNIITLVSDFA